MIVLNLFILFYFFHLFFNILSLSLFSQIIISLKFKKLIIIDDHWTFSILTRSNPQKEYWLKIYHDFFMDKSIYAERSDLEIRNKLDQTYAQTHLLKTQSGNVTGGRQGKFNHFAVLLAWMSEKLNVRLAWRRDSNMFVRTNLNDKTCGIIDVK